MSLSKNNKFGGAVPTGQTETIRPNVINEPGQNVFNGPFFSKRSDTQLDSKQDVILNTSQIKTGPLHINELNEDVSENKANQ